MSFDSGNGSVTIADPATDLEAEVVSSGGLNRLAVDSSISSVEVPLGKDPIPDHFFTVTIAALPGGLRYQIVGISDPTGTERDIPAVDKTVAGTIANDDRQFAEDIVTGLNGDTNFQNALLEASVIDGDNRPIVHVTSTEFSLNGEYLERPTAGDITLTPSGSATITVDTDQTKLVSRAKEVSLARDINNPHKLGTQNVSGTVNTLASGKPPEFFFLHDSGSSEDQSRNLSNTDFNLANNSAFDQTRDFLVTQIIFSAVAGSIQVGKWIEVPELSNGVDVTIVSQGVTAFSTTMTLTQDIRHRFAIGMGAQYQLTTGSGDAMLFATFENAFILKKNSSDDVTFNIDDDLSTSSIERQDTAVVGFFI